MTGYMYVPAIVMTSKHSQVFYMYMYLYSWWANDPMGVGHLLAVAAFWARPRSYKSRIGHLIRLRSCDTGTYPGVDCA